VIEDCAAPPPAGRTNASQQSGVHRRDSRRRRQARLFGSGGGGHPGRAPAQADSIRRRRLPSRGRGGPECPGRNGQSCRRDLCEVRGRPRRPRISAPSSSCYPGADAMPRAARARWIENGLRDGLARLETYAGPCQTWQTLPFPYPLARHVLLDVTELNVLAVKGAVAGHHHVVGGQGRRS
jgi:hypothetical protein